MYQWKVTDLVFEESATVKLNTDGMNQFGAVEIDGPEDVVFQIQDHLESAYGVFGHQINVESVSAIDLDAALQTIALDVKLTKGTIKEYDPEIKEEGLLLL